MPKTQGNKLVAQLRAQIAKWRGRSRVTKNSNNLAYLKIKSTFAALQKEISKDKLQNLATELGLIL